MKLTITTAVREIRKFLIFSWNSIPLSLQCSHYFTRKPHASLLNWNSLLFCRLDIFLINIHNFDLVLYHFCDAFRWIIRRRNSLRTLLKNEEDTSFRLINFTLIVIIINSYNLDSPCSKTAHAFLVSYKYLHSVAECKVREKISPLTGFKPTDPDTESRALPLPWRLLEVFMIKMLKTTNVIERNNARNI